MGGPESPVLALVGGGRWGRQLVSVLAEMELPFERVFVVSAFGALSVTKMLDELNASARGRFRVVPSLHDLLRDQKIDAAIVVNAARLHFTTAKTLLERGIDVLVEKPVVLSMSESRELEICAQAAHSRLVPGLQYRFCRYLHRFSEELHLQETVPAAFACDWADASGEWRYGEEKRYDASLNVAQDVMPHIWTILSTVLKRDAFRLDSCRIEGGGRIAHFDVAYDDVRGTVRLARDSEQRRRHLWIRMSSGKSLDLDFGIEPGTITVGAFSKSGDPLWEEQPRPLKCQLAQFIFARADPSVSAAGRIACVASVAFSVRASDLLKEQQRALLRMAAKSGRHFGIDERLALHELLCEPDEDEFVRDVAAKMRGADAIAREAHHGSSGPEPKSGV